MPEPMALHTLLESGREGRHPVAFAGRRILDFEWFRAGAAAWRDAFARHPGAGFALYFDDSSRFACALFGAWHAGKRVYLPADTLPSTLLSLRAEVDGFAGDVPDDLSPLRATDHAHDSSASWEALDRSAQALVVYTSGSSGAPKPIVKRLSQLFDEVAALGACFDTRIGDAAVLASVSHQHVYGLLFRILWPLAAGRPFDAARLVFPEEILAALQLHSPALLVSSPALLKRLPEVQRCVMRDDGIRGVFSSGGPLPAAALPRCREVFGQAPIEVYGSSETGGVAWRQRHVDSDVAWIPLPGVSLRVHNGTLQVRSAHLVDREWHEAGDRVRPLEDGFELIGRADRIVKVEEKRVSLDAMEEALLGTRLLDEARVVPLEGSRLLLGVVAVPGEAGWALHERGGKQALNDLLRASLACVVDVNALPRRWRYVWSLPRNPQGKIIEAALVALFDRRWPETRLLRRSPASASLRCYLSPDMPFFAGHFPGAPIVPGVSQIDWVIHFGREIFALPPRFLRMEAVKFQRVIGPRSRPQLDLDVPSPGDVMRFRIVSGSDVHASGRIVFGESA